MIAPQTTPSPALRLPGVPLLLAVLLALAVFGISPAESTSAPAAISPKAIELGFAPYIQWPADLDPERFYPVSKVRPGMKGVGKTVFEGIHTEEFQFVVLGVMHNFFADSDVVWVRLESPRLREIGVVAGMSGSPVYIDGKMLGAVAYGYSFLREPIAGITPIEQMIRVLAVTNDEPHPPETGAIASNWEDARNAFQRNRLPETLRITPDSARELGLPGMEAFPAEGMLIEPLACPLTISSSSPFVREQAQKLLSPAGMRLFFGGARHAAAPATSSGASTLDRATRANREIYPEKPPIVDGAALGVTLMRGALDISGIGTVTLVHGNRLVAFGHPMFGEGAVDVPMTSAVMFGIMPSIARPFKIGEPYEEIGSVRQDRSPAIGGSMNFKTPMMPMRIDLHVPAMGESRVFEYEILPDRYFGPILAFIGWLEAVSSADAMGGPVTLESRLRIHVGGGRVLERKELLSGDFYPLFLAAYPLINYIGDLFNNPYQRVRVEKIEIEATLRQRTDLGVVMDARLDRNAYRPGETANLRVWIQRWLGETSEITIPVAIPAELEEGSYSLALLDGPGREQFEYQLRPYLARPLNLNQMIDGMEVAYPSNALYLVLSRPESGLALRGQSMPGLPDSVLSAMRDSMPAHQSVPLSTRLLLETRQQLPYEIGGSRSMRLQVDRRAGVR